MDKRSAIIERATSETQISITVDIDGDGQSEIVTGVGFFDHMLTQIARHGLLHLTISANGDLHIDDHHTVEDVGIALGTAIGKALGDKKGIVRYGHSFVPMDEALVLCALDFSGRGHLEYALELKAQKIGTFDTELVLEFFRAVAVNAGITLHIRQFAGSNAHHIVEAAFKAFGRALDAATRYDDRVTGVPSSKGAL
ncbi:MAG: imidazoleglycerol-phosphate dehydratase HisB [Capsulimonadaceae bacterium]|nr:imidazoleglycerol-phosphate dehydratase HisB [Capsulimonadaceae bacterium]